MLLRSSYPRQRLWSRFSLIELMIGLAIVGILSSMVVGLFGGPSVIYGYFKSKDVSGQLESVASAMPAGSLVGAVPGTPVFQASVVIKQGDGSLVTFSTDDRQWAAFVGDAAKGKCATARITRTRRGNSARRARTSMGDCFR